MDGTVLLLANPPVVGVAVKAGLLGVELPSFLEFRDDTDRFLRSLPSRRTLLAPALALDADRPRLVFRVG